jgi:hypothetical protein
MRNRPPSAAPAAGVAGVGLLLLYLTTLAPDVTFWDAGELATAFARFGIPHPPGTPLFVVAGRAWTWALGGLGVDPAVAANLLSAACTAGAGAVAAGLLARWTRRPLAAVLAAFCAGATSSVWLSATETEVYGAALLLVWLALAAADGAARCVRWGRLAAYALAAAVPLHLSALVATPAAALLAARGSDGGWRWGRGGALLAVGAAAAAAGGGRWGAAGAALVVAALLAAAAAARDAGCAVARGGAARARVRAALAWVVPPLLALSALLVLLVRARHDPALNQGDPSTFAALADVVARRQYAVAPLWPRQAPWWLQLGNLGQWADWQFALGLDDAVGASARRTPVTLAYLALGAVGARWHWRIDRRGWGALALLLVGGSLGVAAYLNLKAGPSYGWGVLPDGAPREARERDYFFAVAFHAWGLWAGLGAWAAGEALARRLDARWPLLAGGAVALLPAALNWPAADRRRSPEAELPAAYASALLASAPPRAVLLLNADNDSYPVWFAQLARGARPDVATVTVSLLGAQWYRAELARRHALLPPALVANWRGTAATLAGVAAAAARDGRPLAASLVVAPPLRPRGGVWTLHGVVAVAGVDPARSVGAGPATSAAAEVTHVDTVATARAAADAAPALAHPARAGGDGVAAWAQRQLACPALALHEAGVAGARPPAGVWRVERACRGW